MKAHHFLIPVAVLCALLLGADFVLHRHGHFDFEEWKGFYPAVTVASSLCVALGGGLLHLLTRRGEDYYD